MGETTGYGLRGQSFPWQIEVRLFLDNFFGFVLSVLRSSVRHLINDLLFFKKRQGFWGFGEIGRAHV